MAQVNTSEDSSHGAILLFVGLTFGLLCRTVIRRYVTSNIPYPVMVLIGGVIIGLLKEANKGSQFAASVDHWLNLDGIVIFTIFLPTLVWNSAYRIDFHVFRRALPQLLVLVLPGLIGSVVLQAVVAKFVFQDSSYKWSWTESFVYASMLAPSDPVAVISVLSDLGASKPLQTILQSEGFLNDGSAIVIFNLVAFNSDKLSGGFIVETFCRLSFGGIAVGLVFALLCIKSIGYLYNDKISEIGITLVAVYGSFILSEITVLKVSGVLAVTTVGLLVAGYGKIRVSSDIEQDLHTFWDILSYIAETAIFVLSGMIVVDKTKTDIEAIDWGYMIVGYAMMYLIRSVMLCLLFPVLSRIGYGMSRRDLVAVAWGGLKGTVSLTLALVVEQSDSFDDGYRRRVQFHVAGICFLSLLINGSLSKVLLKYLKIGQRTEENQKLFERTTLRLDSQIQEKSLYLHEDRFLGEADWSTVWSFIPIHTRPVLQKRILNGRIPRSPDVVPRILKRRWKNYIKNYYRTKVVNWDDDDLERSASQPEVAKEEKRILDKWKSVIEEAGNWWSKGVGKTNSREHSKKSIDSSTDQAVPNPIEDRDRSVSMFSPLPKTDTVGLRSETRKKFIKGVQNVYWYRLGRGLVGNRAMTLLSAAEAWQFDRSDQPMSQFSNLLSPMFSPKSWLRKMELSSSLECLSNLFRPLMFNSISVQYDVACNFIAAHENMIKHASEEWGSFSSARVVAKESAYQVSLAHKRVNDIIEGFPEIVRAVQTQHVVMSLLRSESNLIDQLKSEGAVDQQEYDKLLGEVNTSFVKAQHYLNRTEVGDMELSDIGHFSSLSESEMNELRKHSRECYFSAGETIVSCGTSSTPMYVIIRGSIDVEVPVSSLEILRSKELTTRNANSYPGYQNPSLMSAPLDRTNGAQWSSNDQAPIHIDQLGAGSFCSVAGMLADSPRLETVTAETFVKAISLDSTKVLEVSRRKPSLHRSLFISAGALLGRICSEKLSMLSAKQMKVLLEQSTMYTTSIPRHRTTENARVQFDRSFTLHQGNGMLVVHGAAGRLSNDLLETISAVTFYMANSSVPVKLHNDTVVFVVGTNEVLEYVEKLQVVSYGSEKERMEQRESIDFGASGSFVSSRQLAEAVGCVDEDNYDDDERRKSSMASVSRDAPPVPARPPPK